jgi:uncharacterized protein (TIGR02246 family)
MPIHELNRVIGAADKAIMAEDLDTVMDFYDEHATLVVRPGLNAVGKEQIRKAFVAIADYFNHSLKITQDKIKIIESGDTALVIAEAVLDFSGGDGAPTSLVRRSTYVFRKNADNKWLCLIDNSYGTDLLNES